MATSISMSDLHQQHGTAQPADFPRHPLEPPVLRLEESFYPFGFPVQVRSNSQEALELCFENWRSFRRRYVTEPVQVDIHVLEDGKTECPPAPIFRMPLPLITAVADADNYSIVNLAQGTTMVTLSAAALRHPLYARYFFVEAAAAAHLATRFTTPVHAACIALGGRGALLCGESGAGKSTLSFACARSGFQFVSDDASFLLRSEEARRVTGNCNQVRLRPASAELFPEIAGLEVTPRAAGKPSIEVSLSSMPAVRRVAEADVDFLVFLNRSPGAEPGLLPYSEEAARVFLRGVLFGLPEQMAVQYRSVERLLTAEVLELRYTELDWAVERLRILLREGR